MIAAAPPVTGQGLSATAAPQRMAPASDNAASGFGAMLAREVTASSGVNASTPAPAPTAVADDQPADMPTPDPAQVAPVPSVADAVSRAGRRLSVDTGHGSMASADGAAAPDDSADSIAADSTDAVSFATDSLDLVLDPAAIIAMTSPAIPLAPRAMMDAPAAAAAPSANLPTDTGSRTDPMAASGVTDAATRDGPSDPSTSASRDLLSLLDAAVGTGNGSLGTGSGPLTNGSGVVPTARASAPAATPASAPIIDTADMDAWVASVASDLVALKSPSDALHFRLHPATLGTMNVALSQQEGETRLILRVETIAAQQMLNDGKGRLFDLATGNGVDVSELRIELASNGGQQSATGQPSRQPYDREAVRFMTDRRHAGFAPGSIPSTTADPVGGGTPYRFA